MGIKVIWIICFIFFPKKMIARIFWACTNKLSKSIIWNVNTIKKLAKCHIWKKVLFIIVIESLLLDIELYGYQLFYFLYQKLIFQLNHVKQTIFLVLNIIATFTSWPISIFANRVNCALSQCEDSNVFVCIFFVIW